MFKNSDRSLSVLYLIESAGRGGAESVVVALATPRGRLARVASLRTGWMSERITEDGVPFGTIPYVPRSELVLAYRIAKLIEAEKPDVVHCHCFTMNIAGALGAGLAGVPSIGTVHGAIYDLDTWRRRLAYRVAGIMHSKVVGVSHYLCNEFSRQTGIPPAKLVAIYNGVPAADVGEAEAAQARRDAGLSDTDLVVGSVGMFRPEKGHADLIDAVALAKEQVRDLKLVLVGDGGCRNDLRRCAGDRNLNGTVRFLSPASHVPSLLSAMDIFALPSHTEGLSIATIEAMACGTPVVVTDCGGPTEIVTDGVTGLVVPPCAPRAMADAIVRLANDRSLRNCLAANGKARAKDVFSLDRMLERYEQLYEEVAQ